MEKKILEEILKYMKMAKTSKLSGDGREVVLDLGEKKAKGFASSILLLSQNTQKALFNSSEDLSVLYHWLSYFSKELFHCSNNQDFCLCLKYINDELLNRPYLCGFKESIADLVLFIALNPFINEWSFHMKESYINISRWFSTIQSSSGKTTGLSSKPVTFSRTLLFNELIQLKIS